MPRAAGRARGGNARGSRAARPRTARAADSPAPRGAERLQKVLASLGLASRREAEQWIRAGRLTINGKPATLGVRVVAGDAVRLDGRLVRARPAGAGRVFVCHRSPGEPLATIGTAEGASDRPGLLTRLPRRAGQRFVAVSPMPRVDGGLELVSSDGELAARLQRAVHLQPSEFSVRVRGELSAEQQAGVLGGTIDSGAQLAVASCSAAGGEGANRWYALATRGASGKEVRQLFERQGAIVSRVLRTQLGPVRLERTLARGRFRELTAQELQLLTAAAAEPAPPVQELSE